MNNSLLLPCKNIFESSSNGIIIFDLNHTVTYSNSSAIKLTKLPSSGYHIDEVFKIFPELNFHSQLDNVLKNNENINIPEVSGRDFFYEIFITPVIDETNTVVGGSILLHDISYIKRLEEIKTKFLTVAAHQLRTPLGGMRWSLEMVLENKEEISSENQNLLNQVYQSNMIALSIVNDLLNVSKIENQQIVDKPEPVNIIRVIQKVLTDHQAEAKIRSVNYKVNLPPAETFPIIQVDKGKIKEIIGNLVANAIKYNKPNGSLSVTVNSDQQNISFSIADTGIGIPEKDLQRIFTKFFRAGNAVLNETSGSGLGLFVVKKYIEDWGGKVSINSKENIGTTVNITLPMNISHVIAPETQTPKNKKTIITLQPQSETPISIQPEGQTQAIPNTTNQLTETKPQEITTESNPELPT
ncbi:MAG: PAS domain-containing sensor histidine kinase [Candidatus Pacebacteria bacterium]|nr:PAS domain-containing sensor histidine kinase [Candidatus Paceibacterota bacterium]